MLVTLAAWQMLNVALYFVLVVELKFDRVAVWVMEATLGDARVNLGAAWAIYLATSVVMITTPATLISLWLFEVVSRKRVMRETRCRDCGFVLKELRTAACPRCGETI